MGTKIEVYRSFSCNNSSSYRLVARFADAARAEEVATELREFLTLHAQEMDSNPGGYFEGPSPAATALAEKYGFTWTDSLGWGDDMQEGDEPKLVVEDKVLVVWHGYCNGFGEGVPEYLRKRGANVDPEGYERPNLSALFRLPATTSTDEDRLATLRDALANMFSTIRPTGEMFHFKPPWADDDGWGDASYFFDGKTVGMYFPILPEEIDAFKKWMTTEAGAIDPVLRLCQESDHLRFRAIHNARCTACKTEPLEYLDPRVHKIDSEQLACAKCGGMFELQPFIEGAARELATAKEAEKAAQKK
jgi:hypothetical protein